MRSEEEVIRMLERIEQLPPGYTVHALQAILKLVLERDADEDIIFLEQHPNDLREREERDEVDM